MKRIFSIISVVALLVIVVLGTTLVGCKTATETTAAATEAAKTKFTVGYQIYYEGNDWSLQFAEEFKYAIATKYADMVENVYYTSDQFDTTKQMNNFDDLVTKGCDIIFLSPLDPNSMVDKIKQAVDSGIKVVVFGTSLAGEDYTAYANVNDYSHGKAYGEWMGGVAKVKGKVGMLSGIAGTSTAADVLKGVQDALVAYPDITLLPEVFTDWDFAKSKKATQDILQANPDLAGIITHSDPRASAEVFLESGKPLIPITWMGSNGCLRVWKENMDQMQTAKSFTKPPYISAIALDIGMKALKGEAFEKNTEVPVHIITAADIDKFYNPKLSDRFWTASYLPEDVALKLFPKE